MSHTPHEQAIALAGVFQAARLVDQIAQRGLIPQNSFEASIESIFVTSPKHTADVFGGAGELPYNLSMGLKALQELVSQRNDSATREMTRYALSMLHLEAKLRKTPAMLNTVSQRLEQVRNQAAYFHDAAEASHPPAGGQGSHFAHASVIGNLANLYQETLSTFSFRIQVTGDPRHLQNPDNANKIRALLLAGIRAAILWRQVGGRRWQLLFFRSRVARSAREILAAPPVGTRH